MVVKGINQTVLIERSESINYVLREIGARQMRGFTKRRTVRLINEQYASYDERFKHVDYFNSQLKAASQKRSIVYFDLNDQFINATTNRVHDRFLPTDTGDNHIVASVEVAKMHIKALATVLNIQHDM